MKQYAPYSFLSRLLAATFAVLGSTAVLECIHAQERVAGDSPALVARLSELVHQQSAAWNRGDIDGFMQAYWKSEKLTFSSGGGTTRGWKATRDRYKKRYPDQKTMGKLTFSKLEVHSLGDAAAMMLGRWHLEREAAIGGNFTLIWRKIDQRWLIVHDHTSSDPVETRDEHQKK